MLYKAYKQDKKTHSALELYYIMKNYDNILISKARLTGGLKTIIILWQIFTT